MKAASKAAACASIAVWLLTICLAATIGLSASHIRVEAGGFRVDIDPDERRIILSMKVIISNDGFLDLSGVSLKVSIVSSDGEVFASYEGAAEAIRAGSSKTFEVNLKPSAEDIIKAILSGKQLAIDWRAEVEVAGLIKAYANATVDLRLEASQIGVGY